VPNKIHLTVATVVVKDDTFLMVHETQEGVKVINQPAGHVEPGEDVIAAAIRETLEETCWNVQITGYLGFSNVKSATTDITYYRHTFLAEPVSFDATAELDPDIDSAQWMSATEIRDPSNVPRSDMVVKVLEDYEAGRVFSLEMFSNGL